MFFFRTGQNWGNRAYFPKADRALAAAEVLGAFIAQFYDDKPLPALRPASREDFTERELLAEALSAKSGHKVDVSVPQRGEKKELVDHALANAREALGRKLAETSSQQKLLRRAGRDCSACRAAATHRGLRQQPHPGHQRGRRHDRRRAGRFRKNQYRKFNIRSAELTPGDDYGMMREVLKRRFKRLIGEAPRAAGGNAGLLAAAGAAFNTLAGDNDESPWPDLVLIDGGHGQLAAARETLAALGITDVPLVAIAKGPDRDAGRETFFAPDREPFKLPPRDPVLYFIQRLRDEAHRFAIGSHRHRRKTRHPRGRPAGNPRHRADAQACAAASFRHPEGDRARFARRSRAGPRHQRRDRAQDLRFLSRLGESMPVPA